MSPPHLAGIRPASPDDLPATARLHRDGLPEGFFARIGAGFLRRYHQAFAESPVATVLVADDRDGRTCGMLVGTFDNDAHYRWVLRRRGPRLALCGLGALAVRPRLAAEFLRTRVGRYARAVTRRARRARTEEPTTTNATPAARPRIAVLTHVVVAPEMRGSGAGRELVGDFVERARTAGAEEVRLITAAHGHAAGFYRRMGWCASGSRRGADGTLIEEFHLPL